MVQCRHDIYIHCFCQEERNNQHICKLIFQCLRRMLSQFVFTLIADKCENLIAKLAELLREFDGAGEYTLAFGLVGVFNFSKQRILLVDEILEFVEPHSYRVSSPFQFPTRLRFK